MKKAVIDAVKMVGAIFAFLIVYGLADWLGGAMPMWVGLVLLIAGVAGLVTVMLKIAKDGL
jgi:hypothetical protein